MFSIDKTFFLGTAILICHNVMFITQLSHMFLNTTIRSTIRALNQRLSEMIAPEGVQNIFKINTSNIYISLTFLHLY